MPASDAQWLCGIAYILFWLFYLCKTVFVMKRDTPKESFAAPKGALLFADSKAACTNCTDCFLLSHRSFLFLRCLLDRRQVTMLDLCCFISDVRLYCGVAPVILFLHQLNARFCEWKIESERKVWNPPLFKGLRTLRTRHSSLTKLPIIRGKTHGEQKG